MPNNAHTIRLTFKGTINSVQTWSTSCWFRYYAGGTAIPSAAEMVDAITNSTDFEGYVDNLWAVLSGYMGLNTTMATWEVAVYGEDPTTPAVGLAHAPNSYSGASSPTLPPECALVASLRTARSGASYRGRMYLPLSHLVVSNQGLASDVAATDVANAVAAFFTSVDGHTFQSSITSDTGRLRAIVNSTTKTMTTDVSRVLVDTRIDAQRRREDKIPGTTHAANVS